MTDIFHVKKCPLCGSEKLVYNRDTGEIICGDCGYVVKTVDIDPGPEWRTFEGDETDRGRAGPPQSPLITDRGITTVLGNIQEGYGGGKISKNRRREFKRVRKWVNRVSNISNRERNLRNALNILLLYGEKLGVPRHVLERGAEIYRMALDKDLIRGRSIRILAAASLYIALREFQTPHPIKSIAKKLCIEVKKFNRYYNLLLKDLNIRVPRSDASLYIRRIVSKAGLSSRASVYAEKIVNLARKRKITAGKDPVGLASAAVYYASLLNGYKITQRDIAKASEVTEMTVRNRCKYLMKDLGFRDIDELRNMLDENLIKQLS